MKINDVLKAFIRSRKLFRNWLTAFIETSLAVMGVTKKNYINVRCLDGGIDKIPLIAYMRLLYALYKDTVRSYNSHDRFVEAVNGMRIPLGEVIHGDSHVFNALLEGWNYDAVRGYWFKGNLKFKHMYYFILEIFERGVYSPLNVSGRDVIDVGAFVGGSSVFFALNGARRIVALEPHPKAYQQLIENIKLNRLEEKVIPVNAALASRKGFIDLAVIDVNEASIAKSPLSRFLDSERKGNRVEIVTLEEMIKHYNINEGVLKMDCEGCEYDIILNDFEHIELFDELIFEYHAQYTKTPADILLKTLAKSFYCERVGPHYSSYQGIIYCVNKR